MSLQVQQAPAPVPAPWHEQQPLQHAAPTNLAVPASNSPSTFLSVPSGSSTMAVSEPDAFEYQADGMLQPHGGGLFPRAHSTKSDNHEFEHSFVRRLKKAPVTEAKGEKPDIDELKKHARVLKITDPEATGILEPLIAAHGRSPHAAFLDESYRIYIPGVEDAAICFKISKGAAVVYGDPVCAPQRVGAVFEGFRAYAKFRNWLVVCVGASPVLAHHVQKRKWRTLEFAVENGMNPMNNAVLDGAAGKTIRRVNRNLEKAGVKVMTYVPAAGRDLELEKNLAQVYFDWRNRRVDRSSPNTHATCLNVFALPGLCRYLYTVDSNGVPNSLACLMQIGAIDRFLIEPCIAGADAPKGTTELLVVSSLELLKKENVTYLTFGFAPLPELGEITGVPHLVHSKIRGIYRTTFDALNLGGKKVFHEKFKPDEVNKSPSYLLFPSGMPHWLTIKATLEVTHISIPEVWERSKEEKAKKKAAEKEAHLAEKSGDEREMKPAKMEEKAVNAPAKPEEKTVKAPAKTGEKPEKKVKLVVPTIVTPDGDGGSTKVEKKKHKRAVSCPA